MHRIRWSALVATNRGRALTLALSGLWAAGCGHGSAPVPPANAPAAGAAPSATDPAVLTANRTMAAGVPIGDGRAPLETRFELTDVPTPGVPFTVNVAVIPGAPAPLVRLDVTSAEGLLIFAPAQQVTREKVAARSVVPLEIRAASVEPGVRVLYVKATLELPDGPQSRSFAFPVLVGPAPGPAPAPGNAPPAAKPASR
jgi:hypothetical protein